MKPLGFPLEVSCVRESAPTSRRMRWSYSGSWAHLGQARLAEAKVNPIIGIIILLACCHGTSATAPPPRISASIQDLDSTVVAAQPLLQAHGYVLLQGLDGMNADQMRTLMAAFSGEGHTMLRFGDDTYGDHCVPGVPEVRLLGRGHPRALLSDVGYEWHQDGGGTAPFLTMLYCKEPCEGADTLFADGEVLFRRLSAQDQQRARSLTAIYSNRFTAGGPTALDAACGLRMSACGTRRARPASRRKEGWSLGQFERPLVETAAPDGRERLLAGAKGIDHFREMDEDESANLLSQLLRCALGPTEEGVLDDDLRTVGQTVFTQDAVYVHQWRRGEALIWDNHRMLHSTVPPALYRDEHRLMWQVICKQKARLPED
jgi:alpha-ketoglutarate-dependent taurine dioxygenase